MRFLSESKNLVKTCLFYAFHLFPIQKKKIVLINFWGKGFGCNPKYIAQKLREKDPEMDLVWLVQPELMSRTQSQIRNVKLNSIKAIYELATAKVWVSNTRTRRFFRKRSGQTYIQTWHGAIGIKKCEGDLKEKISPRWKKDAQYDAGITDLMISNSTFCTSVYRRAFWYNGPIYEAGYPRNDVLVSPHPEISQKVHQHFNLPSEIKIFLYAPTFRETRESWDSSAMDISGILATLQKKWGGNWVCLLRLHPNAIKACEQGVRFSNQVLNASEYDDVQELLSAADVLSSDYSSCIFDFLVSKKPIFMFAPDIADYLKERGFHFDPYQLPFSCSTSNAELQKAVSEFNEQNYQEKSKDFFKKVQWKEDGKASLRVASLILDLCQNIPLSKRKDFIR